jgi:hypothetical protein
MQACASATVYSGLQWAQAFALPLAVFPLGIFFLKMPGILEHDAAQIAGGALGVNRPPITGLDEQRQTPGMIQMRMGQDHGIEALRLEGKRLAVTRLVLPAALNQSAIDQHPRLVGL